MPSTEENIKDRIMQLARDKFFALGFSKVTMDELCEDLGISKKTMYVHFHGKDDLVDAVIEWQVISVKGQIVETMRSSADFVDRIYHLWAMMGKMMSQICNQFVDDMRKFRPDLWAKVEMHRKENILANFSKMIDEGVRSGFVRGDINKDIMVLMYLGAIQSIVNPDVISRHSFSTEEAYKSVLQVYFDGILTDSARQHFRTKLSQQATR